MAHFGTLVTMGFLTSVHITKKQLAYYFAAEIIGAHLESLFVMVVMGH
jgi:aquaporin Z